MEVDHAAVVHPPLLTISELKSFNVFLASFTKFPDRGQLLHSLGHSDIDQIASSAFVTICLLCTMYSVGSNALL